MAIDWLRRHGNAFLSRPVLVTGGAGFLGSHLVQALCELGARVTVLDCDRWLGRLDEFRFDHDRYVLGSTTDADVLRSAVPGSSIVFHFGDTFGTEVAFHLDRRTAATSARELAKVAFASGVERVVYASSRRVYAPGLRSPITEGMRNPASTLSSADQGDEVSAYRNDKQSAEAVMHEFGNYGLDVVSLRFFDTFGPGQSRHTLYGSIIPELANRVLKEQPPVVHGDGNQTRDLNYVDNAVHATLLAARHPSPHRGAVFNVGSGAAISVNYVARYIPQLVGRNDVKPICEGARAGDVMHLFPDIARARDVLGYHPLVRFEDGLRATLKWFLDFGFIKGRSGWQLR